MSSQTIAALIAHAVFWVLILIGWTELGPKRVIVFVILWGAGLMASSHVAQGALLFPSYVAVLGIALLLMIFKGDVMLR